MYQRVPLLNDFQAETVQWMISAGVERVIAAGESVLVEGEPAKQVFVVLDGTFEVRVGGGQGAPVSMLGPGEFLGEISFLERMPATASVVALEESRVLSIEQSELIERANSNSLFAADLYQGLARSLSRRLRERSAALALATNGAARLSGISSWRRVIRELQELKRLLLLADKPASHRDASQQLEGDLHRAFKLFCSALNEFTREISNKEIVAEAEAILRSELTPYIHLTELAKRIVVKPRGYAGDFLTIDWIYQNSAGGLSPLGPLIDRLLLDSFAAHAVRNRRKLLCEEVMSAIAASPESTRITSLACGPAEEIFDAFQANPDANLQATLIDIDFQALAFVSERLQKKKFAKRLRLKHGNLVYLATGRESIKLEPQNLMYSIGLIDYFADEFVVMLLNWIHDQLAPGGKVVLGNFHVDNPDKGFMDLVLDWKLIHRSEEDMNGLFRASKFGRSCTEIRYEDAKVNLFACCVRD